MKSRLYLGVTLLLVAGVCQAKNYVIAYTDNIHSLQDAVQDSVWTKASLLTDFSFPWIDMPAPKTEFRALWTPTSIWFRFDVEDHDIQVGAGFRSSGAFLLHRSGIATILYCRD